MLHQNFKQIKLPNGFFVLPARISPKENSRANGKFLPKPLLFHLRHPNSKTNQPKFWQILSPKNSFAKTSSALVPPPARILGGQNTKEKCPFLFRRNRSRANPKSKEHFSLVFAEALRGGGGADSFVQFPLEKSSRKVYNYSTSSNLFGIKNMERFCGSQNRALIFAKTLSAHGGSREIP
jgi:hypothetical protein